jgi:NAD(P)-dependent dehydrogenase (short-subunit alcohol dehydrogenase family)
MTTEVAYAVSKGALAVAGDPDDAARLVAWLVGDDGRWVTGQVLDSEGGFRRFA